MLKHIAPIAIHFAVEAKHLLPWPFDKLNGGIKVHKTLQICTRETEYFKTGGTRYTEFKFPAKIVMAFFQTLAITWWFDKGTSIVSKSKAGVI